MRPRVLHALVVLIAIVLAVAAPGAAPSGGQDASESCATFDPIAIADAPDEPAPEIERRFAFGYFNTQLTSSPDSVDSDADGDPDQIDNPSAELSITSGRGIVTFRHEGQVLWAGGVGNIDGVPGDEIGVWAAAPVDGARAIYTNITEAWVVPGATPPGDVDPAVVGTSVGTGLPSFSPDRDGDGVPDVIVVDYATDDLLSGSSSVLSGAAIVAAGLGAEAPASSTLLSLPGVVYGFARFDAPADDLEGVDSVYRRDGDIVTIFVQGDDVVLRLARNGEITSYGLRPDPPGSEAGPPVVFAYQGDGADYLSFTYYRQDTGVARTALWEVGECDEVTQNPANPPEAPTTTPPAAPPAVAVTSDARFTG